MDSVLKNSIPGVILNGLQLSQAPIIDMSMSIFSYHPVQTLVTFMPFTSCGIPPILLRAVSLYGTLHCYFISLTLMFVKVFTSCIEVMIIDNSSSIPPESRPTSKIHHWIRGNRNFTSNSTRSPEPEPTSNSRPGKCQ
jgi:hypothetical protein